YVGGWAIAERAQEAVRADPKGGSTLLETAVRPELISARTVFDAYRHGDPMAVRLVRETERYLADGTVGVVNAFNPATLVLGGGLMVGMPEFAGVVETAVRARCQPPAARAEVKVARFGENAPLVGAAEAARRPP
ncbi:MAG TPA: ROK family protein, partial [Thermoplasmata archaeon]|nr:ROK family protein [Thermoplasmata archaeon]